MRPHNGTLTSKAAARKADVVRGRDRIVRALERVGRVGMTKEQIAHNAKVRADTCNARINELGHDGTVVAAFNTSLLGTGRRGLVFLLRKYSGGLALADWPKPREDWKRRALAAEAENDRLRRFIAENEAGAAVQRIIFSGGT